MAIRAQVKRLPERAESLVVAGVKTGHDMMQVILVVT
jgi:hypothetical protein